MDRVGCVITTKYAVAIQLPNTSVQSLSFSGDVQFQCSILYNILYFLLRSCYIFFFYKSSCYILLSGYNESFTFFFLI